MPMTADLRDRIEAANITGDRVYRDVRPQSDPLPAITIQEIPGGQDSTMEGRQALQVTRVQANCLASSRGAADEIRDALIAAVEPAGTFGTTEFLRSFVEGGLSDSDKPPNGGTIFRTAVDLLVWHKPA